MPVYEYRCSGCGRKFAKLVGMVAGSSDGTVCPSCGSTEATRLISRFTRVRGEDERLDALENAALAGGDVPGSMGRLLGGMGRGMSEDGDDGIDELMEESERELYDGPSGDLDTDFD